MGKAESGAHRCLEQCEKLSDFRRNDDRPAGSGKGSAVQFEDNEGSVAVKGETAVILLYGGFGFSRRHNRN